MRDKLKIISWGDAPLATNRRPQAGLGFYATPQAGLRTPQRPRRFSLPFFLCFLYVLCGYNSFAQDTDNYDDFGQDKKGITVIGTPETTQQMQVITKDEIEKRNSQDLASLLEESLDMSVTRYGGYGNQTELNLRGFDTERIAILIDGIPANSPRSGEFDINQVDLNNVERIEVIYGGSDTKYNVSGA
jgi:outer membrane receptor for ferrienterochelin and colicin